MTVMITLKNQSEIYTYVVNMDWLTLGREWYRRVRVRRVKVRRVRGACSSVALTVWTGKGPSRPGSQLLGSVWTVSHRGCQFKENLICLTRKSERATHGGFLGTNKGISWHQPGFRGNSATGFLLDILQTSLFAYPCWGHGRYSMEGSCWTMSTAAEQLTS